MMLKDTITYPIINENVDKKYDYQHLQQNKTCQEVCTAMTTQIVVTRGFNITDTTIDPLINVCRNRTYIIG